MDVDINNDLEAELNLDALEKFLVDYHSHCQQFLVLLSLILVQIINSVSNLFCTPPCIPQHTSILTGEAWVLELMNGHPNCIKINFGVS